MTDNRWTVASIEHALAFRRRAGEGWVTGLPKRDSGYTKGDAEILSTLYSRLDDMIAPSKDWNDENSFTIRTSVSGKVDDVAETLGPLLWPGKKGRTPAFIEPNSLLDFSDARDKKRIKEAFSHWVTTKALNQIRYQSRKTQKMNRRPSNFTDTGCGDASAYGSRPHEAVKAYQRIRGTGKECRRYLTKQRLAAPRANKDKQASVGNAQTDIGHGVSAIVMRSTLPMNERACPNEQSCEVILLKSGQKTSEPDIDSTRSEAHPIGPAIFPDTGNRTCREPPLRNPTKPILPRDIEGKTDNITQNVKDHLDTVLKDTAVRLCFRDVDHIIMDLVGCHTIVHLVEKIGLYLEEELGTGQISHVDVARDRDQEFLVGRRTMTQLRLLPGPGRERTYDTFLRLLMSVPSQDESHSFKMYVHTKGL